jgi:hypothetical protein
MIKLTEGEMPQRIVTISRSVPAFRTTGAG